jgi:hypothetical protein
VVVFSFYLLVVVLGILSMGFQLLASRLLSPYFGSGIDVWAWLISTFLLAFSLGSIGGGWISNQPEPARGRWRLAMALLAVVTFAFTAFFVSGLLKQIDAAFYPNNNLGLFTACMSLFFLPVTALSTFGPQNVQYLAGRGLAPGLASGVVYGVSTFGNIAGVMLTALVLIPVMPVSSLLVLWLVVALVGLGCLLAILRSGSTAPAS